MHSDSGNFQKSHPFIQKMKGWSAVKSLIVINIVVFMLQGMLLKEQAYQGKIYLIPWFEQAIQVSSTSIKNFELWRLVTSMFAHGSMMHILFNMIVLWSFGQPLERKMGKSRFLSLYFFSGIASSIIWVLSNWTSPVPALGASGALCGIIAIVAITSPQTGIYFFFIPKAIPIRKFIYWYSGISFILYLLRIFSIADPVNWGHMAHLGGFAGGALWFYLFVKLKLNFNGIYTKCSKLKADKKRSKFTKQTNESYSEVDSILDKISRSGIASLNDHEKQVLEKARQNLKNK